VWDRARTRMYYRAEEGIAVPSAFEVVRRTLAARPLSPAAGKPKGSPATVFKPAAKSVFVAKFVGALTEDAGERRVYAEAIEDAIKEIKKGAAQIGMGNDFTPGLALYVTVLYSLSTGKELSEPDTEKLAGQLASALNVPDIATLSDEEKQGIFEYGVCMGVVFILLAGAAEKDAKNAAALKTAVGGLLGDLFGAEPSGITFGATGLAVKRTPGRPTTGVAVAGEGPKTAPASTGGLALSDAKIGYTLPAGSKVEKLNITTIIWRPKYDGYTKNENGTENLYYMVVPARLAASQPNREAAFDLMWKDFSRALGIEQWPERTLIHKMSMPSGANAYMAVASRRINGMNGIYGNSDLDRLTFCLLDFGKLYVPVAQVYRHTNGSDNQHYLQGDFDAFLNTVRVEGATAPPPFVTRETLIGVWTHSSSWASSTDYYYSSSGQFAGSEFKSSASRLNLTLAANGTAKYEFFWSYNGRLQTDVWGGKWTLTDGRLRVSDGGRKNYDFWVVHHGKHPKSGERFLNLFQPYPREDAATPQKTFYGNDTDVYVPLKK
jgi:hypothetical protein